MKYITKGNKSQQQYGNSSSKRPRTKATAYSNLNNQNQPQTIQSTHQVKHLQQALLHDVMRHAKQNPDKIESIYGRDSTIYKEVMEELDFLSKIDSLGGGAADNPFSSNSQQ